MKLRNKKTGEILELCCHRVGDYREKYDSLAELNEEWEDYEEPKEYWFISTTGVVYRFEGEDKTYTPGRKQIGNYFGTKEEAELVVRKLKAWKRLKYNGVIPLYYRFTPGGSFIVKFGIGEDELLSRQDLDLLFGGEE